MSFFLFFLCDFFVTLYDVILVCCREQCCFQESMWVPGALYLIVHKLAKRPADQVAAYFLHHYTKLTSRVRDAVVIFVGTHVDGFTREERRAGVQSFFPKVSSILYRDFCTHDSFVRTTHDFSSV